MEPKLQLLQKIVYSELLAPSVSSLALMLGVSRTSLNRIIKGTVKDNAVDSLYDRIEKTLSLNQYDLCCLSDAMDDTVLLEKWIREDTKNFERNSVFDVLKAFVFHEYNIFSPTFRYERLEELRRLEHSNPECFFNMLAYLYFKSLKVQFYDRRKDFQEQCARIMEELGIQFIKLAPTNDAAANVVFLYSQSTILSSEPPILWSLITSIATMLRYYADPEVWRKVMDEMRLLNGLEEQSYWSHSDKNSVLMMLEYRGTNPGTGFYELYNVNRATGEAEDLGGLRFVDENTVYHMSWHTRRTETGYYKIKDNIIFFEWLNRGCDPIGLGTRWEKLSLDYSESLRKLNGRMDVKALHKVTLSAAGWSEVPGYTVIDIIQTRKEVRLELENGDIYKINYSDVPALKKLRPEDDIEVVRRAADGELYVFCRQLMQTIPLKKFTRLK